MLLSILLYFLNGFSLDSVNGYLLPSAVLSVVRQDANYFKATIRENEFNEQYEKLNLSDEQRNVIMQWIDAIHAHHAQEAAYTVVAFQMGMQCCFSLLMQLADL